MNCNVFLPASQRRWMMIEMAMWGISIISLIGTVGNIYKRRWCFALWLGTNSAWAAYDVYKTAYPQAALMAWYFVLAAWGLWVWRK